MIDTESISFTLTEPNTMRVECHMRFDAPGLGCHFVVEMPAENKPLKQLRVEATQMLIDKLQARISGSSGGDQT